MDLLQSLGKFALYAAAVFVRTMSPPWEVGATARQIWQLTMRCVLPVLAVVFPAGMVFALQGLQIFDLFGAQRLLSSLIGVTIFREFSPLLTGVLVAAQGGSSFSAEVGAMRIKEEIDATLVMAVDPLRVHVVPRVIAGVVAAPILNLAGSLAGVTGGWVVAVLLKGENGSIYWTNLWLLMDIADILAGIVKSSAFGLVAGLVATYHGFHATGGAEGVGRAVNDTVVISITSLVVMNYFINSAFFDIQDL